MLKVGNPSVGSEIIFWNLFLVYVTPNPMNHWNASSNNFSTSGIFSEPLGFWECLHAPTEIQIAGCDFLSSSLPLPSQALGIQLLQRKYLRPTLTCVLLETSFCWIVRFFCFSSFFLKASWASPARACHNDFVVTDDQGTTLHLCPKLGCYGHKCVNFYSFFGPGEVNNLKSRHKCSIQMTAGLIREGLALSCSW